MNTRLLAFRNVRRNASSSASCVNRALQIPVPFAILSRAHLFVFLLNRKGHWVQEKVVWCQVDPQFLWLRLPSVCALHLRKIFLFCQNKPQNCLNSASAFSQVLVKFAPIRPPNRPKQIRTVFVAFENSAQRKKKLFLASTWPKLPKFIYLFIYLFIFYFGTTLNLR